MKVVGTNRKAGHDYEILDTFDAGVVLEGSEVKSLRQGAVSLSDAYAEIRNGEVYLMNLHITPYKFSPIGQLQPKRRRKLLLRKDEIRKLFGTVQQKGHTLIPLRIYFNERGYAKIALGVCRQKRQYDKKDKILKEESRKALSRIKRITR